MLSEDQEIYSIATEVAESGRMGALATIIRTRGSTPRGPGAKIIFLEDGRSAGTIGGGCAEAEIQREALDVLQGAASRLVRVDLTGTAEEAGMVCGGIMDVFIQGISRDAQSQNTGVLELTRKCLEAGEPFCGATVIEAASAPPGITGRRLVVAKSSGAAGTTSIAELDEMIRIQASEVLATGRPGVRTLAVSTSDRELQLDVFFDVVSTPAQLLVLGGGHISVPLVKMGSLLGFTVTVIDDRPSFANKGRFPEADRVICDDFANALQKCECSPTTYAVIVTRGHQHDEECLRALLNVDLAYLGMIGSKRKVRELSQHLRNDGVSQEKLDQVHAPIGLAIEAETPEEIAVSILGEIIMVRRVGRGAGSRVSSIAARAGNGGHGR